MYTYLWASFLCLTKATVQLTYWKFWEALSYIANDSKDIVLTLYLTKKTQSYAISQYERQQLSVGPWMLCQWTSASEDKNLNTPQLYICTSLISCTLNMLSINFWQWKYLYWKQQKYHELLYQTAQLSNGRTRSEAQMIQQTTIARSVTTTTSQKHIVIAEITSLPQALPCWGTRMGLEKGSHKPLLTKWLPTTKADKIANLSCKLWAEVIWGRPGQYGNLCSKAC